MAEFRLHQIFWHVVTLFVPVLTQHFPIIGRQNVTTKSKLTGKQYFLRIRTVLL